MRRNSRRWRGWKASRIRANELTEAWKKITFNDFHDLAAGSGIGIIYKEAQKDFDQVRWATNEISQKALKTLAAEVNTQRCRRRARAGLQSAGLGAFRAGDGGRADAGAGGGRRVGAGRGESRGAVEGAEERRQDQQLSTAGRWRKDVPSLGYKVLHVVPGTKPFASDLKAEGLTLENSSTEGHGGQADWLHHQPLRQEDEI